MEIYSTQTYLQVYPLCPNLLPFFRRDFRLPFTVKYGNGRRNVARLVSEIMRAARLCCTISNCRFSRSDCYMILRNWFRREREARRRWVPIRYQSSYCDCAVGWVNPNAIMRPLVLETACLFLEYCQQYTGAVRSPFSWIEQTPWSLDADKLTGRISGRYSKEGKELNFSVVLTESSSSRLKNSFARARISFDSSGWFHRDWSYPRRE